MSRVFLVFVFFPESGRYWEDEDQTKKVMRPDPEDGSIVWMHTGDEGIMDEEGYLRSTSMTKMPCVMLIRGCCSCWSNQGPFQMCSWHRMNDVALGHYHSWRGGELLSNNTAVGRS